MDFPYKESIIQLEAFHHVFTSMRKLNPGLAQNIEQAILATIKPSHLTYYKKTNIYPIKLALLEEKINMQAQLNRYASIVEELQQKQNKLWQHAVYAPEVFFEGLFDQLDFFFEKKKQQMHQIIEENEKFYTGLSDAARKTGGLVNHALKGVNHASTRLTGKKMTERDAIVNDQSSLEQLLSMYLNPEKVGRSVTTMLEKAMDGYQKAWIEKISEQAPDLEKLNKVAFSSSSHGSIKLPFSFGVVEQAFLMGLGSTVVGTLGLAAGWHTLSYAVLNVFPPIAIFAGVVTLFTGVVTKGQTIEKKKRQITDIVNNYHRFFITQLDALPLQELEGKTIRKYLMESSELIVQKTVKGWETRLLDGLDIEHYRMLQQAFQHHLLYIDEALAQLK